MLINVTVHAGTRQEHILKTEDGFVVYTRTKAQNGEANQRIITMLAKHLSIPKTSISIRSGVMFKKKIIEIPDNVVY